MALKRVFDRDLLVIEYKAGGPIATSLGANDDNRISYRRFRRLVCHTLAIDGAIAVPWCGMWLCVEKDGYTHS